MNCLIENEYIKGKNYEKTGKKKRKRQNGKTNEKNGKKQEKKTEKHQLGYFITRGGLLFCPGTWRTLLRVVY